MKTLRSSSPRARRPARWFEVSALVAVTAALTLTACGPRDEAPLVGGASAGPAVTAVAPAVTVEPAPRLQGQPVPEAVAPGVVAATSPTSVPAPATTYPADPAPELRSDTLPPTRVAAPAPPVVSQRVGSIESIEPIRERPQGSGAGAVIGGVLGAVVGNQFGHGLGRAAMTGVGVVGGAVAGNNVERNYKEGVVGYRIHVRLDNGGTRTFQRTQLGNLHVGDRVRLDANSFHRA